MAWTLEKIRQKVRNITGRKSTSQLSNDQVDEYINDYYLYDFPQELKPDRQRKYYQFNTVPNQQDYTVSGFVNIQPSIYVEGREANYYQDPNFYRSAVPNFFTRESIGVGDGSSTAFSGTLSNQPLEEVTLFITDDTETFTSDGAGTGTLTGDQGGSGTINAETGAYSVTFNTAPTDGQAIIASYYPYYTGMPTDCLFFDNQLSFYPVPDSVYHIELIGYQDVTELVDYDDTPAMDVWGPLIAVGASRQIFLDNGEVERIAEIERMLIERKELAMRSTINQLLNERSFPRF